MDNLQAQDVFTKFEQRLTRLEVLIEQVLEKQDEFNEVYKNFPAEVVRLIEQTKSQQKEIDEIKSKLAAFTKWGWGIVATLVGLILKMVLGL